jgi:hypothetical protein
MEYSKNDPSRTALIAIWQLKSGRNVHNIAHTGAAVGNKPKIDEYHIQVPLQFETDCRFYLQKSLWVWTVLEGEEVEGEIRNPISGPLIRKGSFQVTYLVGNGL